MDVSTKILKLYNDSHPNRPAYKVEFEGIPCPFLLDVEMDDNGQWDEVKLASSTAKRLAYKMLHPTFVMFYLSCSMEEAGINGGYPIEKIKYDGNSLDQYYDKMVNDLWSKERQVYYGSYPESARRAFIDGINEVFDSEP